MRPLYFLLLTIILTSCKNEKPNISVFRLDNFILLDTTLTSTTFLSFDQESEYPIYYLGAIKDTIKIHNPYRLGQTSWINYKYFVASRNYSDKVLSLFVDTAIKTNSSVTYFSEDPKISKDSTENYHSFLLKIKNISDSSIYLGRTFSLYYLNREAKDRNGNWVSIDKKLCDIGLCLTGQPSLFLKSDEIVISKVKRYKGNLVTDFRLSFGSDDNVAYSNIWRDSIDEQTLKLGAGL